MGIGKQQFKSDSVEYETPDYLFKPLQKEFDIVFDVCATSENTKCDEYFTKEDDALTKNWFGYGNCWMNPPWSRNLKKWVKKAYEESQKGITVVCLLPVRTNTNWWHDYCMEGEVRFLKGEIKFKNMERGLWMSVAIVIFNPQSKIKQTVLKSNNFTVKDD